MLNKKGKTMNFDHTDAAASAKTDYMLQLEKEMREVTEQFERLWKKHGLSKKAYSDEEIAPFKYVALKWYMRGRFNE